MKRGEFGNTTSNISVYQLNSGPIMFANVANTAANNTNLSSLLNLHSGAWLDISATFISEVAAKRLPSSTILSIKPDRTIEGSLYGRGRMLSRILPLPKSTSRNSPGLIGVSSPLMRNPLAFRPPGKFERVPASTSCLMMEVADFAYPPIKWNKPKPYAP